MKRPSSIGLIVAVVAASAFAIGCNSGTSNGGDPTVDLGGGDGGGPAVGPAGDAGPKVIDAGTFNIDSTKPTFQTKSAVQLAASIKACLGPSTLMITPEMIQGNAAATAPVLPSTFAVSTSVGVDDIISVQRGAIDGDPALLRLGTRADSLTLEYVTAQRNVANVVAANCVASKSAMCKCDTGPDATALMKRCLPQLDPTSADFVNAATILQGRCATNQGQAIASFVASAALSKLP